MFCEMFCDTFVAVEGIATLFSDQAVGQSH